MNVWIQDIRGTKRKFKLRATDAFSKLMDAAKNTYIKAGKASEADEFTFIWDDDRLQPQQTPEDLNWEDDEVVDIMW